MKKLIVIILCASLFVLFGTGCVSINYGGVNSVVGMGDMQEHEFRVGEIREIRMELYCDINYYSAPSDTVTLKIQPNLIDYITVEETGGVLTVRSSRSISQPRNEPPVLTVSSQVLDTINFAGAGTFTALDTISGDSFTLKYSGAGAATAELDVDSLVIDMSGAGSAVLSGRADKAEINLSGAGSIEALSLQTRDTVANLAGAGVVRIACSDNLSISAGGIGTVEYIGSPSIDLSRGGIVTVNKLG